jgi:hypothetical protein
VDKVWHGSQAKGWFSGSESLFSDHCIVRTIQKCVNGKGNGTAVEQLSRHPKVEGLNPASPAGNGKE